MMVAGEIEAKERLAAALAALEKLNLDLTKCLQYLSALAYSLQEHEKAKVTLASADREELKSGQEGRFRAPGADRRSAGRLGATCSGNDRKEELERNALRVARRMEVVEVTRGLVNRFMDQILIRVKNDIVRSAGEILRRFQASTACSRSMKTSIFRLRTVANGIPFPVTRAERSI